MKYKELIKLFNRDVIAKGHKFRFTGNVDERQEQREQILADYTGTFENLDTTIGIRAESQVAQNHLALSWSVNAIRDINGRLMSIEYRHMTPEEMKQAAHIKEAIESIERDNRDIDTVLADLGFVKYTREEVA